MQRLALSPRPDDAIKAPPMSQREFTVAWTIEHYESGCCIMQCDCELDCLWGSRRIYVITGRFTDCTKPVEFDDISDERLYALVFAKLREIEDDPKFQRRASETFERVQS